MFFSLLQRASFISLLEPFSENTRVRVYTHTHTHSSSGLALVDVKKHWVSYCVADRSLVMADDSRVIAEAMGFSELLPAAKKSLPYNPEKVT